MFTIKTGWKTLPGLSNSSESFRRSASKSAKTVVNKINTALTHHMLYSVGLCKATVTEGRLQSWLRGATYKDMSLLDCTVLGLALSWVFSGAQCSGTGKSKVSPCMGESNWHTTLEPWDTETEVVNWEKMRLDLLRKLKLYSNLDFIYLKDNMIIDVHGQYCLQLSLGFKIETITSTQNTATAAMPNNRPFQILTDICHLGNLSFVKSVHNKALLNDNQMSTLLSKMNIIPNLEHRKDMSENLEQLSLQGDMLSYINPEIEIICQSSLFLQGHHSKMVKFKAYWEQLWVEISTLEHLIYGKKGQNTKGKTPTTCLKLENHTVWETLLTQNLDRCIRDQEKLITGQEKLQKRSSIWSIILGEGSSIDKNTDDLNKISEIFNKNFHAIHKYEGQIRGKINRIIEMENNLNKQELTIYHHLQMLEMQKHLDSKKGIYQRQRKQQIDFLLTIIQNSRVQKLITKLRIGLNIDKHIEKNCKPGRCMTDVRVSHNKKGLIIKTFWSKHVIQKRIQITCAPIQMTYLNDTENSNNTWYISNFHRTVQDCFEQGMGNRNFCNNTFRNDDLRETIETDYDFPQGIIMKDNNQIQLYCTRDMYIWVNDIKRTCAPNLPITIPNAEEFKIETEDRKHRLEGHNLAQKWTDNENVYKSEIMTLGNDISKIPIESQSVDYVGSFFELADGNPHKRNISILGTSIGLTLLTITGALVCWCRPTCISRICPVCPQTRNNQETRARMMNNILNQISEEISMPLEGIRATTNRPPTPPTLVA